MRHRYWTTPIALYLFLGGLGGGIMCLTALFDFFVLPGASELFVAPMLVAVLALGVGCCFLVFELGQPPVFWRVFATATSIIKWGAVLLSVALVLGFVWLVSFLPGEWIAGLAVALAPARGACLAIAGVAGFCIMLYTGIMLSTLKAHAFWATPALPVLFTVSALSTACAALTLSLGGWPVELGIEYAAALLAVRELLHLVDIVLVAVELTVLLIMVLSFLGAGTTTAQAVARRWVTGRTAPAFWGGMVGLGLVVPLACYIGGGAAAAFVAPVLVLASGVLLRFLVVWADDRREIPGENRFYGRLPHGDERFLRAWSDGDQRY
ncbi:NrfD/PsrC family molybdoenzyme membrane anchor subunit [Eggerthella sinensis]|uniref:NrfD/PsrC family molybdoenzyme membrane anchor subunit n=1 Tax=Eggerthella sinensis TaxID=242230 RepID=UPI0022E54085|nr:NrfD/PsrC family molybdoenzyme membrane anchor subunit [Eggerthella sinensis]